MSFRASKETLLTLIRYLSVYKIALFELIVWHFLAGKFSPLKHYKYESTIELHQ